MPLKEAWKQVVDPMEPEYFMHLEVKPLLLTRTIG
jgi:hypothetical protein